MWISHQDVRYWARVKLKYCTSWILVLSLTCQLDWKGPPVDFEKYYAVFFSFLTRIYGMEEQSDVKYNSFIQGKIC